LFLRIGVDVAQHFEVRAVGTTDEAAMGYYIVQLKSEPYALQADAEGMSGIVTAGVMVVDGLTLIGFSEHHIGTLSRRN
jgi:hypothetical protein